MLERFQVIEHTADIGLVARGRDLREAFANVAFGMFSLIADLDLVAEEVCFPVVAEASDQEGLLVEWLNELIYLFEVEHVILKRFEIGALDHTRLEAEVWGERIDPGRHELKMAVKAATYHLLEVEQVDGARVQVILDV